MTGRVRHRLVASMLVAALGTACGGGGTNKDVHPSATEPRRVAASRPYAPLRTTTTSTTKPIRTAEFDRVPPPRVIDRGNDRVAVVESLLMYGRWLDWHHPDPALTTNAYLPGSVLARGVATDLAKSFRFHRHVTEVDSRPLHVTLLSALTNGFSFQVTEYLARRERIDSRGRVLERVGSATESYVVAVLRFGPETPWRLVLVERKGPPIEVQL